MTVPAAPPTLRRFTRPPNPCRGIRRIALLILLASAAARANAETFISGAITLAGSGTLPRSAQTLPTRDLGIGAEAQLFGTWYPTVLLGLIWDAAVKADNAGRSAASTDAPFSPKLNQLLFTLDLPAALRIEAGRAPFTVGEALLRTPANLLDPSGGLEDARSFWRAGVAYTPGNWSLSFDWIPDLGYQTEPKWRGFTNPNPAGFLTLGTSWFAYPLNIHLRGYLSDRLPAESVRSAGAATATWNILPTLILKGEFLTASQSGRSQPDITTLGALVWSPIGQLELNTEYLFNSRTRHAARSPAASSDPLEQSRHVLFLLARLHGFDSSFRIQSGLLIALDDRSLAPSWDISFAPNAEITIFCRGTILTGSPGGIFTRAPAILTTSVGVTYGF